MSGKLNTKRFRFSVGYAEEDYWLATELPAGYSGVGTRENGVPTPFCTSKVTWRFGFFIGILRVAPGAA